MDRNRLRSPAFCLNEGKIREDNGNAAVKDAAKSTF